jgi:hypothetical protein
MTTAAILAAVLQYGPSVIPLIQQLVTWAEGGKTTVTAADFAILVQLSSKSSADYLAAAGGPPVVQKV